MTVHSSRWRRRSGAEGDMSLQWLRRHGDTREHTLHDVVRGDVLGQRFERKNDAVTKDIERQILDILARHVPASPKERQRASGEDEVDRGARTRTVGDVLR